MACMNLLRLSTLPMPLSDFGQTQVYRFLWGDLPLFAFNAWLQQAETAGEFEGLYKQLLEANQQREQLEALLWPMVELQAYTHWRLQQVLPWIIREDPRACLAIALVYEAYQQGAHELAPVALAYHAGEAVSPFDWNLVRERVPELKADAEQLLQALTAGTLCLSLKV